MLTKTIIVAVVLAAGVALYVLRQRSLITPEEAKALFARGALLVDVRTPREYAERHIDGAVNIPVHEVPNRFTEFGEKPKPIILYCRSGIRSGRAMGLLNKEGFTNVHDLGSIRRWV